MAVAALILSAVMLRGRTLGWATANIGIVASVLSIADDVGLTVAPGLAIRSWPSPERSGWFDGF